MLLKQYKNHFFDSLKNIQDEQEIESFFFILTEYLHNLKRVDVALNPNFEISEEELMLDIYRQKFDFIARNLNQVVSTIEAVIHLTNYVNQENITEQDTSKMLANVSYCFVQAEMSDTANFASLLMI